MKAALILTMLILGAATPTYAQRPDDYSRYGTEFGNSKKGEIRAKKYPGNLYGIEAFSRKKQLSPEAQEGVSRQVVLRAAQLALENDREFFGMFSPKITQTQAETRHVRGFAPSSTWDAVTMPGYATTYIERQIPGTSGYSYQLPRYEGAWTMVKLFTRAEVSRRGSRPADGMTDYNAEAVYLDLVGITPGRWPALTSLYEDLADRAEEEMADTDADAPRLTAINTQLKLSRLYREAGQMEQATPHLLRAGALIRKAR